MSQLSEIELIQRALEREKKARKEAESLLEKKSAELYERNQELLLLNQNLSNEVDLRTKEVQELAFLSKANPEPVFIMNGEGIIRSTNPAALKLAPDRVTEEIKVELNRIRANVKTVLKSHKTTEMQARYNDRFFSLNLVPFPKDEFVVIYGKDITENLESKQLITESEEKYRGMIENLKLGILEVDNKGIIQKAYPSFCELTGYSPEELEGKNGESLLLDNKSQQIMRHEHQSRKKGSASVYEVKIRKKSGEHAWVLISGAPIISKKQGVVGSIGVHLDITSQKETLEKLQEAIQAAETARKSEQFFITQMSHEIRTPLNGIIGMSNIIQEEFGETTEIKNLIESANYLNKLVGGVLDLSNIGSGNFKSEKENFDPKIIVGLVRSSLSQQLKSPNVELKFNFDETVPEFIYADLRSITQIINNLVSNAIKYGASPIECHWQVQENRLLKITVKDCGKGIPEDQQLHLFEKYQRDNSSTEEGFGIGLHLSLQIANSINGNLFLGKTDKNGSTFVLEIPIQKSSSSDNLVNRKLINPNAFKGVNCLIAEDNNINYLYLNHFLNRLGIQSNRVAEGTQVIKFLERNEVPDLFLLDLKMPGMNGIEVTRWIRKTDISTPIILQTANALPAQIEEAKKAGVNEVIFKPFSPRKLEATLSRLFASDNSNNNVWNWIESIGGKSSLAKDVFGSDDLYALEMIKQISSEFPGFIEKVEQLINQKNNTELISSIHQFSASLGMLTINELKKQGEDLEVLLNDSKFEKWNLLQDWLEDLKKLYQRINEEKYE